MVLPPDCTSIVPFAKSMKYWNAVQSSTPPTLNLMESPRYSAPPTVIVKLPEPAKVMALVRSRKLQFGEDICTHGQPRIDCNLSAVLADIITI